VEKDGAESDRKLTDELTRYLRDNPGAPVVDNIAAALKDTRPKAQRRTDLLLACLIVVVALELLHFVTPWGKTDIISNLGDAIEHGRWALAAVNAAVLLFCVLLLIPFPYVLLRSIRWRDAERKNSTKH
jgi:hypothetical protein